MCRLRHTVFLMTALSAIAAVAFGQYPSTDPNVAEQYLQKAADEERGALHLPPLRLDPALVSAAHIHARRMAIHDAISHQFDQEPDLAARAAAAGARFSLISENVAQAPSAVEIQSAWMHSEGHRHNLLDPNVDAVGIAVVKRGTQLFAVEDFERTLAIMSLQQQERAVSVALVSAGIAVKSDDPSARATCALDSGHATATPPDFIMRYTTADLTLLPQQLRSQISSGKYARALVGACPMNGGGGFSMYRIAVLLFGGRKDR